MKKAIAVLLPCFWFIVAQAQKGSGFQVNLYPGYLIGHRELMANMEAHTFGVELNYTHNNTGNPCIDTNYNKLRWGVAFDYFNLGNPSLNGEVFAGIIHVEANVRTRAHSRTAIRVGTGVGYLTKRFDAVSNPYNSAIGSHINGSMQLNFLHQFFLSNRWELNTGFGITHFSNGNFRKPNLGINMAHAILGASYFLDRQCKPTKRPIKPFGDNGLEVAGYFARKQISVQDPIFFNIGIAALTYYFKHNNKRNWRVGAEFFFDKTDPYEQFQPESVKNLKLAKWTEIAVKGGHEFVFGRVLVVTDIGIYAWKPTDTKRRVYFSIGLSYCPFKNVVLSNRLKSHLAVADYFQWGAGYRLSSDLIKRK